MYDIIEILKSAVEQVAVFKVKEVEFVTGTSYCYKFTSCDFKTYWLKPCMKVTIKISNIDYIGRVEEIVNNKSVTIKFDVELPSLEIESFDLKVPSFVHGIVPMADLEIKEVSLPMPVCYLYELFQEKLLKKDNPNHSIGKNLRIHFVNDYGDFDLTTKDHYENVIRPMRNFAYFVLDNLKKDIKRIDGNFIEDNEQDLYNRVKTGVFKGVEGNKKALFTRNLSGVELVMDLAIKKDNECCNCC